MTTTINTNMVNTQKLIVKESIQPILDNLNFINQEIIASINSTISVAAERSLNSIQIISEYSPEAVENVDKDLLASVVNEICVVSSFEDSTNDLCSIKTQFKETSNNQIAMHTWVGTIIGILGLLLNIFTALDNSFEKAQIENQKQIIEYQAEQLKKLENIDSSLQKLIQNNDD